MRKPVTYTALENLGRVRLSRHFYMRNFLNSEIANFHGKQNIPDDPNLAVKVGRRFAQELLDPMVETFGPIEIRSALRSADLNHFGATQVRPQKCARNEKSQAGHIWDQRDDDGLMGATVSIVIPWFADQYEQGRDWRDLAWWLHDHLPYSELYFFPKLAAFNFSWHERPKRSILSYVAPRGTLLSAGSEPKETSVQRANRYADFPKFRGIIYPSTPHTWQPT